MENKEIEVAHSKLNMASYAFGTFLNEFIMMAFFAFAFFFYEGEIGLNVWLVGLGYIIFAIWNAVNDPIVGYLTNRPFKFTKKWGRRFPWILISGIPLVFSYILVFTPPTVDPKAGAWIIFGWLIFSMCLFDTFASIFWVNYASLFPDKFRSGEERRTSNGINILIGVIGTVSGAIVPPLFIVFGNFQSYIVQAGVVLLIGFVAMILTIPGVRDDQIAVDRYLASYDEKKIEETSFFKSLRLAMKQKNFIVYIIIILAYQTMIRSMTASIPYVARFILKMEANIITIIMGSFLVSVIISTPFWVKLAQKTNNNRKVFLITGILLVIFTIPLIFVNTLIGFIIAMIIWGLVLGGFWFLQLPIFADVIDESVVEKNKREEGIYNGINQFFSRIAMIIQALSFAIVHSLTGFVEGADSQSEQAIIGIHIHFAVVPLFALLIGVLVFYKFYDLTPEKVNENQLKIKQLKL